MFAVRFLKVTMGLDGMKPDENAGSGPVDMDEEVARAIVEDLKVFGYNGNVQHEPLPGGLFVLTDREIAVPHGIELCMKHGCEIVREAQPLPSQGIATRNAPRSRAERRTVEPPEGSEKGST